MRRPDSEGVKQAAAEARDRLRDRRRKERQRLEELFDRKTFNSLLVLGSASKIIERLVVPIIALEPVRWNIAGAYVLLFVLSVAAAVYWTELAARAGEAADAVEDAVSGEGSAGD